MKLTGKTKEDFETWYSINIKYSTIPKLGESIGLNYFYNLPIEMQIGVYQLFFYHKTELDANYTSFIGRVSKGYDKYHFEFRGNIQIFDTIYEAWEKAIEKANEIYNNRTTEIM